MIAVAEEGRVARTGQDIGIRVADERAGLVRVLESLSGEQWSTPSLCAGWTVRDLVVHLLMPYEVSRPRMIALLAGARLNFDRAFDRWARSDARDPAQVLDGLRATARGRFDVGPGAPPAAELSHLVIHAQDVLRPLGVPSPTDPSSAALVLDELTGPRGRRTVPADLREGFAFAATDARWSWGTGEPVTGPATALLTTLAGRTAALDELSGAGADRIRERSSTTR